MPRRKMETWAKLVEMCRARYPGRSEEEVRVEALELSRLQMQQGDDVDGTFNAAFEYGAALGASGSSPARNYEQVLDARRAVTQMAATREDARERTAEMKAAEWAANPEAAAKASASRNAKLEARLARRRAERSRLDAVKEEAKAKATAAVVRDAAREVAAEAVRQPREEGLQLALAQDVQDEESRVAHAAMTAVWVDNDDTDLQDDFAWNQSLRTP